MKLTEDFNQLIADYKNIIFRKFPYYNEVSCFKFFNIEKKFAQKENHCLDSKSG